MNKKRISLILAMLVFFLTGCKMSDYKKATEAFKTGQYQEAAELFEVLGTYEDSKERANESWYKYAEALMSSGNYQEAAECFETLGTYEDSKERANESWYKCAEALMDSGNYQEAADTYGKSNDYKDSSSKILQAQKKLMQQTYKGEIEQLTEGVWFFESESYNAVNAVTFTEEKATLKYIYYDGNGKQLTKKDFDYIIDDSSITIITNEKNLITDEEELTIAYTFDNKKLAFEGMFFTAEQIEEGLEGYWGVRYVSFTGSMFEYIYRFEDGYVKYEHACEAEGYYDGTYYYYGPYHGTYFVGKDGLEMDTNHNYRFGFVISKGEVTATAGGGRTMTRYSGFKGENGFYF